MSSGSSNQTTSSNSDEDFPVAAIVCLAVGGYVVLVVVVLLIRHKLVSKGTCKSDCCGSGDGGCCEGYCLKLSEACPCCCSTTPEGCLSRLCGKRKRTNCIDILLCNCCGCTEGCCDCCKCNISCCSAPQSCFPCSPISCCSGCSKTSITCSPSCATCCQDCCEDDLEPGTCGCLCLEIKLRNPKFGHSARSRSLSLPRGNAEKRAFSTHVPPSKQVEVRSSTNSISKDPALFTTNSSNNTVHDQTLRQRTLSSSPQMRGPRNRLAPLDVSRKVPIPPRGDTATGKVVKKKARRQVPDGNVSNRDDFETGRHDIFQMSLNSTSSAQLSSSLSEESYLNSSASGKVLIKDRERVRNNNSNVGLSTDKKSSSRSRRSVRAGQMSQRFPNKVLVDAQTLQMQMSQEASGEESLASGRRSKRSSLASNRALPQPKSSKVV